MVLSEGSASNGRIAGHAEKGVRRISQGHLEFAEVRFGRAEIFAEQKITDSKGAILGRIHQGDVLSE